MLGYHKEKLYVNHSFIDTKVMRIQMQSIGGRGGEVRGEFPVKE